MSVVCRTYSSEVVARHAVESLTRAGLPGRDIRLIVGHREQDLRQEPAGEFAGPVLEEAAKAA